jgi:hypothetical protein
MSADGQSSPSESASQDQLKIKEQYRDFQNEQWFLSVSLALEQSHKERMWALENVSTYGLNTTKTLFLLNGGAIIAFMTFIGSLYTRGDHGLILAAMSFGRALLPAFYSFIAGLCLSAIVSGLAYLNFSAAAETYYGPWQAHNFVLAKENKQIPQIYHSLTQGTAITAVVVSASSLICFVIGCSFVAHAVATLGL